jgi:5-formyltetrahydrofolate cyclo-ligase
LTHFPSDRDDDALAQAKSAARAAAVTARQGSNPDLGAQLGALLLANMPPPFGAVIAGFWSLGSEIDIRPLLNTLHVRGHQIVLPQTPKRGAPLVFRRWTPQATMIRERFGTYYPDGELMVPDWLLIPLLAFDRAGRRLGYGGGFYDRTLAEIPAAFRVGCAYAAQELDVVPAGDYDARLDAVATEAFVISCERHL